MRPHIRPARQESAGRGGHGNGLPLLFLGGLNRAFLRSCCGAPIPVKSMRVRLSRKWQPGLSPGLNGKEDAAVQHHSAMPGNRFQSFPAFMENNQGADGVRPPFVALPPIRSALRHIKSSPASAVQGCLSYARRAAYLTLEKNYALYRQHCFSRSARTPRCNHCKARTGLRLS